jgi:hypothetical protein
LWDGTSFRVSSYYASERRWREDQSDQGAMKKKSTEDRLGMSGVGPAERKIRANHFSDLPVASVGNFMFR